MVRRARGEQDILSRLDPRAPLVVDTRELGRRPGSLRRLSRTAPAPAGLGNVVLGVPEGSELEIDLRLEAVVEGVLVTGSVRGRATGECVRCLEPVERKFDVDLQALYAYPTDDRVGRSSARDGDDEDDVRHLEGDRIDLEPELRDAVVLALPLQPVCRDDCPGLCPECGQRLADDPDHQHEAVDARWAALHAMYDEKEES